MSTGTNRYFPESGNHFQLIITPWGGKIIVKIEEDVLFFERS